MLFTNTKDNSFEINNRGWRRIFLLATMFDWRPRGTLPPPDWNCADPWNPKNYHSNDGQRVTALDAFDLANAIERAIDMLEGKKHYESIEKKYGFNWELEMIRRWKAAQAYDLKDPAFIFFDIRWEEKLLELVNFNRQGEFVIN